MDLTFLFDPFLLRSVYLRFVSVVRSKCVARLECIRLVSGLMSTAGFSLVGLVVFRLHHVIFGTILAWCGSFRYTRLHTFTIIFERL